MADFTSQLDLIPVGLKEAALDSPTFRATTSHFAEQVDLVEKWLEGYLRFASKLVAEVTSLEGHINSYLSHTTPPTQVSEAILDHDYTLLALRRYTEGAREFWQYTLRGVQRYDTAVIDPIKNFMAGDLKVFKETKKNLEACQRAFDGLVSRYASQGKTKEASSLREDAFQLYEGRKAYLKAAMDFCTLAPQLRAALDRLLVVIFAEQWKEMRSAREANATMFAKWNSEMDRVRGWGKEMDNSNRAFQRELSMARRQIEDNAEQLWRPSRELEDYNISTVSFLSGAGKSSNVKATKDKQGWLFQKTYSGKPARTYWTRRWFFVRNGIFGWLVQGPRSGGVEESEKIGVLLCSVRAAAQEERRFCFEVKTKDTTITLQAETQAELQEWINAFEMVKRRALENPASSEPQPSSVPGIDPAFAITPPVAPEFAAKPDDKHSHEDTIVNTGGLTTPDMGLQTRASFDVTAIRRVSGVADPDNRDTSSRLMSKLDLHKRNLQSSGAAAGGIASLISASHNVLPVGPGAPPAPSVSTDLRRVMSLPNSTLAPSTLANPPAHTNLSHAAVMVSTERNLPLGNVDGTGIPSGIMANTWGSSNWGHVNRIGEEPAQSDEKAHLTKTGNDEPASNDDSLSLTKPTHRKTISATPDVAALIATQVVATEQYPSYYPASLKAQNVQFRMLFPGVPRQEKVVLVFRATWNPNEQQEFPGRVYITTKEVYFYSHHLGLVLITGAHLANITEVTAAPGRDCDFIYLHLKETTQIDRPKRITIKTFLEPLKLLRRRLNYLVHNAGSASPDEIEEVLRTLLRMETDKPERSSSVDSWEEIGYSPTDEQELSMKGSQHDMRASIRIDGTLYGENVAKTGKEVQKFRLPAQPVKYAPKGMQAMQSREYKVSAKALFHVIFGDKSAVFQLLYCNRWGDNIEQTPWTKGEDGHYTRKIESKDSSLASEDVQTIDVYNEHLCYVVTNIKQPWRLPYPNRLRLTTKLVITHVAKSRCKLAVFQQVRWIRNLPPSYIRTLVEKEALNSLEADALDLTNITMDQVTKLGNHSKTNKAVDVFGGIGQHQMVIQVNAGAVSDIASSAVKAKVKPRKVKVTLTGLLFDDVLAKIGDAITAVLNAFVRIAKGIVGVCNAHSLLVVLLLVSSVYNSWHSYRDGLDWYHERNASKFMSRLAVASAPTLSKAIYIHDLDAMIASSSATDVFNSTSWQFDGPKTCTSTFQEHLASTVPGAIVEDRAGRRLQRSRGALGKYRHDLLVALRVVNNVERDIVEAEWKEWVSSERRRCSRLEAMLERQHTTDSEPGQSAVQEARLLDIEQELAAYCQSCRSATDHA